MIVEDSKPSSPADASERHAAWPGTRGWYLMARFFGSAHHAPGAAELPSFCVLHRVFVVLGHFDMVLLLELPFDEVGPCIVMLVFGSCQLDQ